MKKRRRSVKWREMYKVRLEEKKLLTLIFLRVVEFLLFTLFYRFSINNQEKID